MQTAKQNIQVFAHDHSHLSYSQARIPNASMKFGALAMFLKVHGQQMHEWTPVHVECACT